MKFHALVQNYGGGLKSIVERAKGEKDGIVKVCTLSILEFMFVVHGVDVKCIL